MLRRTARQFLVDSSSTKLGTSGFNRAVLLALGVLERDLENDEGLRGVAVSKWSEVPFGPSVDLGLVAGRVAARIHRLSSNVAPRCLLECLEGCNRAPQFGIDLRRFTTCWDRELSAEVKSFVADKKVRPEVFRGVLAFLSGQDRPAAVEVFERLRARRNATSTQLDDWGQALVVVGLLLPEVGWAWAWPKLSRCHLKKAQSILLALARGNPKRVKGLSVVNW